MIKNPKDVAKLITHNLRVKFLNTNFVNKKLQLNLPTLFFEQPYIIGYICNFARWSNIAYCTLIKKKQIVDKQQQLNFNAEVYKFLNLPNDTIKTYLKPHHPVITAQVWAGDAGAAPPAATSSRGEGRARGVAAGGAARGAAPGAEAVTRPE